LIKFIFIIGVIKITIKMIEPNTENFISINRNNYSPIIIERNPRPAISFEPNNWMSYGSLANPNDQQFIPGMTADDIITIYDKIYFRQNSDNAIPFYTFYSLRPQMTVGYINNAVTTMRNFFSDTSLVSTTYASSSGGMTSHCLYRNGVIIYNIYMSLSHGPNHIEIIDESFIDLISGPFIN
jgi:hypothetical protein